MPVYYGQDDDINTLPILFACVVVYGAYKFIKSVRDEPSRQEILEHENKKIAEQEAKARAIVEQNGLSSNSKSPSLDSIAQSDEAKMQADAVAKATVRAASMFVSKAIKPVLQIEEAATEAEFSAVEDKVVADDDDII